MEQRIVLSVVFKQESSDVRIWSARRTIPGFPATQFVISTRLGLPRGTKRLEMVRDGTATLLWAIASVPVLGPHLFPAPFMARHGIGPTRCETLDANDPFFLAGDQLVAVCEENP